MPIFKLSTIFSSSNGLKTKTEAYYSLEEGHSAIIFSNFTEELEKQTVLKHAGTYLFPHFKRVPAEVPTFSKELVRHFTKEQEGFTNKMMEKSNPPPKKQ
ncbi:hypothetical protein O181_006753 [Austropuccinia psidii MF-1]|uniref:Uncharacterized protein n=1 Tax=Austropuccinia psidii MF-1 TaxID=1389203 RepID=A0A9Q3BL26_9BASI|nr:hypothetical protein [Austropuccinia psidii MF-1]